VRRERRLKGNPLVRISGRAARDMIKFAAEVGIGPATRARIAAGPQGESPGGAPSKFDGLSGG
jgi:phage terminase small subunit